MNRFYKIQLATIISIISIVSIPMNVDQAFAFCDAHSEPCFERIKTFDKIDDHFVRNYFFDYADDIFVHYDWPNKSDNVRNNFDGFPAIYCFEIVANDEPHFLMTNWIDQKSISNIVDMYVPELCEQSINPINSENRPDSLYVNKSMEILTPKSNVLMLSTPNIHPDDLQSCLLGDFDDKNYGWCNNYKEKMKSQSPLRQFQSGIPLEEIQCKENFILVQKYDISPACVKEQTISKLIERGWITHTSIPEPGPPPISQEQITSQNVKKALTQAYYENVNLGPLKINDVIVGFGIENNELIIDVLCCVSQHD